MFQFSCRFAFFINFSSFKPDTKKLKPANSILEYFEYFCQISCPLLQYKQRLASSVVSENWFSRSWEILLLLLLFIYFNFIFFDLRYSVHEGAYKLTKQYKGGYDRQSMLSAAGKLSWNKTALKRCTKTEIL